MKKKLFKRLPHFTRFVDYFTATCSINRTAPESTVIFYVLFVFLLTCKAIWGIWYRDLTIGDTSSYYTDALRWHHGTGINIVWSPLYTAYYGSWLTITENAIYATLLHRIGLIILSTGLVAWFGYLTLPRILALLLVSWWVGLPIHYDTLFEVHLFGAIPILLMATLTFKASKGWHRPLLLGIALVSAILIRNEYASAVAVIALMETIALLKSHSSGISKRVRVGAVRYIAVLLVTGCITGYFYSVSRVQGPAIHEISAAKHTFNMCQGYAFGYLQRNTDWNGNPWTECSDLMFDKFGTVNPSLYEMLTANPAATMEHFLWNLSLVRSGAEVLLFNATSSNKNPDFVPVIQMPVLPNLLLVTTIVFCAVGTFKLWRYPNYYPMEQQQLIRMMPLIIAVVAMGIAVTLIQRPRPSYLLGQGVIYMWLVFRLFSVGIDDEKYQGKSLFTIVFAIMIFILPSYSSLKLPSKNGSLGDQYVKLRPIAPELCIGSGNLVVGHYANDIHNYLCGYPMANEKFKPVVEISSFSDDTLSTSDKFINALNLKNITALVIDNLLITKNPGLKDCITIRDALLSHGWRQLFYSIENSQKCTASYIK